MPWKRRVKHLVGNFSMYTYFTIYELYIALLSIVILSLSLYLEEEELQLEQLLLLQISVRVLLCHLFGKFAPVFGLAFCTATWIRKGRVGWWRWWTHVFLSYRTYFIFILSLLTPTVVSSCIVSYLFYVLYYVLHLSLSLLISSACSSYFNHLSSWATFYVFINIVFLLLLACSFLLCCTSGYLVSPCFNNIYCSRVAFFHFPFSLPFIPFPFHVYIRTTVP